MSFRVGDTAIIIIIMLKSYNHLGYDDISKHQGKADKQYASKRKLTPTIITKLSMIHIFTFPDHQCNLLVIAP